MSGWAPRPASLPSADARLLVVEASAGTGKTFFLEHRVVDLVLAGARIDEILLVTFTEKATAELRLRIRDLLGALASAPDGRSAEPGGPGWIIDDAARERLEAARHGFDRAAIYTIHGFCQRVLVEDAFAGRRLFEQEQVADDVAFADAFRLALREALATRHRALLKAYLSTGKTVASLHALLLRCARTGAEIGPIHDPARVLSAVADLRAALAPLGRGDELEPRVTALTPKLNAGTRRAMITRLVDLVPALAATPDEHGALVALALANRSKQDFGYLPSVIGKTGSDAVAPVLHAAAAWLAASSSLEAACAIAFLPEIEQRLRDRKAQRGQFDYQDMLRLVWDVLDGDRGGELAARLRRRHPWAMIDEFQDTDLLQWNIFRRVWMDDDGGRGGLTIVGDPKQAIYSFRGADVHTYVRARKEMRERGASEVRLDENHRSSAPMIAALDQIFAEIPGAPFFTGTDITYQPVRASGRVSAAGAESGRAPAPVHVFRLVQGDGAGDWKDALITRVAAEIDGLLRDLARRLTMTTSRGSAPVRARDIFVLTRTNADAKDAAEALRARGIPCAHRQAEHLFQTPEAADVADLLDAIAAPRDRGRRLRAWMTAFFAVPLAELGELGDVPDSHPLVAMLYDWRELALRRDYERLFARILDDSRLAERALVTGLGARTVGNVLHVFEILQAEVARSRGEIHEVVAQLRRWIALGKLDRPDDSDVQRLDHDGDAVHVMTTHRAKGLEAAVVFVVGGAGSVPNERVRLYHDGDRRIAYVGDPDGDAQAAITTEQREENQRLCYVALTRAKVRLYLWHGAGMRSGGSYQPVYDALGRLLELGGAGVEVSDVEIGAAPRAAATLEDLAGLGDGAWPVAIPPRALGSEQIGFEVTSYTRLAQATPDDFRADTDVPAPIAAVSVSELPPGATTGLFLHQILEHVDFASARDTTFETWSVDPRVEAVVAEAARDHGLADAAHLAHARDIVWKTLTREVVLGGETMPPLCQAARIAREVEFAFPLPGGRGFAKGFIDLLVAWDERVWVVDYKSNVLGELGLAAAAAEVERSYRWQTRLYAIAAQRMLGARDEGELAARFGGLAFWFVRPQLIVAQRPTWAELERWHETLPELPPQPSSLSGEWLP